MGSKPGVQVTLGLICDDPVCSWQPEPGLHIERDSAIVAAALDGVKVLTVASAAEMSRQRVYQIFEAWRRGV